MSALPHWMGEVATAASAFERRWTGLALRRVDAPLARRLSEQKALFDEACVTGSDDDVARHGAATVRGYRACVLAMEASGEADDAALVGWDARSGLRVAIGHQRAAADRVAEVHGQRVIWISPDEVAALVAGIEGFKTIAMIKQFFPGAEVVDTYPGEPAKADGGIDHLPRTEGGA